ncbi:hybrid sensor histidine kinase/response regulator [Vibrio profundum]|uniref:hybrid sensor histidine kinase/response regulator n=1 Tax=Vibrio profundum TaxID=2910247 RepID=UPI003D0ABEF1
MNRSDVNSHAVILVVDDNPENLALISTYLKECAYQIAVAKNGESAIEITKSLKPDLILLDIQMPKMNGFDACKIIKKNSEISDIPIIFMSALTDTIDKVTAFEIGAVDYIIKPVDSEELIARVNTHLTITRLQKENLVANKNLEHTNSELTKSLQELKIAQDALVISGKMAGLAPLVSGVAHSINTPLGICITGISHLKHTLVELEEEIKQRSVQEAWLDAYIDGCISVVDVMTDSLDRTKNLISRFKEVSVSQFHRHNVTLDLVDCIGSFRDVYGKKLKDVGHRLSVIMPENCTVNASQDIVFQILSNLVDNSLIHGLEGKSVGNIVIEVSPQPDEHILLTVRDDGCGMKDEVAEKCFDPFFSTHDLSVRSGLGLSITYSLVTEGLGGKIELKSWHDGAQFSIVFPASKDG